MSPLAGSKSNELHGPNSARKAHASGYLSGSRVVAYQLQLPSIKTICYLYRLFGSCIQYLLSDILHQTQGRVSCVLKSPTLFFQIDYS